MESYRAAHVIEYGHSLNGTRSGTRRQAFVNPFKVTSGHDRLDKNSPIEQLKAIKPKQMIFLDRFGHFASMQPGGAIQIVGYDY